MYHCNMTSQFCKYKLPGAHFIEMSISLFPLIKNKNKNKKKTLIFRIRMREMKLIGYVMRNQGLEL